MIAVAWIARDIVAQPVRRSEIFRRFRVIEFHFGHDESFVAVVINIYFDDTIAEGNFVARFREPLPGCRRPERVELRGFQLHFPFFAHAARAAFEREEKTRARFS